MALMLPKSKFAAKFWSDGLVHEDEYLSGGPAETKLADIEDTEGGNADEDSDDDEYQDLENDDSSDDNLSLIHISEPTRHAQISYAVFCLKKKKHTPKK